MRACVPAMTFTIFFINIGLIMFSKQKNMSTKFIFYNFCLLLLFYCHIFLFWSSVFVPSDIYYFWSVHVSFEKLFCIFLFCPQKYKNQFISFAYLVSKYVENSKDLNLTSIEANSRISSFRLLIKYLKRGKHSI